MASLIIIILMLIAISICVAVHVLSMAAAGWLVGVPIEKISIFFGPHIKQIVIGNTIFELNIIPLGGSVKFSDAFWEVHPIKQIFITICGCLALVILAMIVFGTSEGFYKFIRGFFQIISGAFSPRSVGAQLLLTLYEFLKANSFAAYLGLFASKFAAANLLPIPVLNGGEIILMLLNWIKPMPVKSRDLHKQIGFVLVLIIYICWIVALIFSLRIALI